MKTQQSLYPYPLRLCLHPNAWINREKTYYSVLGNIYPIRLQQTHKQLHLPWRQWSCKLYPFPKMMRETAVFLQCAQYWFSWSLRSCSHLHPMLSPSPSSQDLIQHHFSSQISWKMSPYFLNNACSRFNCSCRTVVAHSEHHLCVYSITVWMVSLTEGGNICRVIM